MVYFLLLLNALTVYWLYRVLNFSAALPAELFKEICEDLQKAIIVTDERGRIFYLNKKSKESFEKIVEGAPLDNFLKIMHNDIKEPLFRHMRKFNKRSTKSLLFTPKGKFSANIRVKLVKNFVIFFIKDLSAEESYAKVLEKSKFYDKTTRLYNTDIFFEELDISLARSRFHEENFALIYFDITNYQNILNLFGMEFIDEMVARFASVFKMMLEDHGFIARISGSKFALIMRNCHRVKNMRQKIEPFMEKFRHPMRVKGHEIYLNLKAGVSFFPYSATDRETLHRYTNFALLKAQKSGADMVIFTPKLKKELETIDFIKNSLPSAIKKREFDIYLQPKLDLKNGKIESAEVLIRWPNASMGPISPSTFIPIAEETGDIIKIGEYVIKSAFEFLNNLKKENGPLVKLAINISQKQLENKQLPKLFEKYIKEYEIDPSMIEIEVTESSLMEDDKTTWHVLTSLKKLGICLSLDDFGTGYSSLQFLSKYPFDKIKIDKTFIEDHKNIKDRIILHTIFTLSKRLRFQTVVEGIETKEQLDIVKKLECDQAQGFFICKPLNRVDFKNYLLERKRSVSG